MGRDVVLIVFKFVNFEFSVVKCKNDFRTGRSINIKLFFERIGKWQITFQVPIQDFRLG